MAIGYREKTITLEFSGFWREKNVNGVPAKPGVYTVHVGRYNPGSDTVRLRRLIYIGEASNARDRIKTHELRQTWKRYVDSGDELIFAFAGIILPDRHGAEAALINHHKPPVNKEYVKSFPFDTTTIVLSGCTGLLDSRFTVYGPTP